ncbi:hypothetical protein [Burkholderia sp. LMU1-1-1.1]|uniref:hypothetical protein n=1 Tax=Burkholderia sp. LMU1-1-1.1 TaxID=3135266 RepID=UPI003432BE7E
MAEKNSRCCCIFVTVDAPKKVFIDLGRFSQRTIMLRARDNLLLWKSRKWSGGGAKVFAPRPHCKTPGEKKRT